MIRNNVNHKPSTVLLVAAFLAIYFLWGATFLAMRFAVASLPPFFMTGTRQLTAGIILYIWARARGDAKPKTIHWRSAAIIGALMLVFGNAMVVRSEQWVPSGLAAVLISTISLWMVLLDWLWRKNSRPNTGMIIGLVAGFGGILLLVGPNNLAGGRPVELASAAVLIMAAFFWALGSIYTRHAPLPSSNLLATAMELVAGGVLLFIAGSVTGEWSRLDIGRVTTQSVLSLGYLIVFGSIVGMTAYTWLLKISSAARVGTYAFVNPVVAVVLGWFFAGERLTLRTILAAAIIVGAVALINICQPRRTVAPNVVGTRDVKTETGDTVAAQAKA
ncbi:MAG TPA: EamA family transporter [Blastocatellia bacterium]|nr:EamA family transporter [Blastocatellia bacterium]